MKILFHKKVVAIIQARMESSRFPGKSLYPLMNGHGALELIIDRLRQVPRIDDIVVAMPDTIPNAPIVDCCRDNHCACYRGAENDVLGRVHQAAIAFDADVIVDITADCPFIDPGHVETLIKQALRQKLDYACNIIPRSWPDGFDVQVYTRKMLDRAVIAVDYQSPHRSHVGWNIPEHKMEIHPRMKIGTLTAPLLYRFPKWGLTLDTPQDLQLLIIIGDYFSSKNIKHPSAREIIDFIKKRPALLKINSMVKRKTPGQG